jgi:hypothetical protein
MAYLNEFSRLGEAAFRPGRAFEPTKKSANFQPPGDEPPARFGLCGSFFGRDILSILFILQSCQKSQCPDA